MLKRLRPYLLFAGLTVIYHANLRPVDSGDSLPASLIPLSLALDHSITLNRFAPWLRANVSYAPSVIHQAHGSYYSVYPVGAPLLVAPLYLPAMVLRSHDLDTGSLVVLARIAQKFSAAAAAALSAVLLLLLLERITTPGWALCFTLVYALGTETWSISSQALWQHGPGELAIVAGFFGLERWWRNRSRQRWLWFCGACAAAAVAARPTNIALLAALVLALLVVRAKIIEYISLLTVPILGGLLLAAYNFYVFQRPSGGYLVSHTRASMPLAIAGLFFSPGRGLLIYTPVALFAIAAFLPRASAARASHKPLFTAAAAFLILATALICSVMAISPSVVWWGGYCWGPRMLTELSPAIAILLAFGTAVIARPGARHAFLALALYSILIQAAGAFYYPNGHWDAGPPSVDSAPARLWNWRDNPIGRTLQAGVFWQPYSILAAALHGGLPAAAQRMRQLKLDPY